MRGIIDWQANKGLSYFNDDPGQLRRAADYLENHPFTAALGEKVYGVMGKVTKKARNRVYGPNKTKTPQPRVFKTKKDVTN